jgi:hypothetical protein
MAGALADDRFPRQVEPPGAKPHGTLRGVRAKTTIDLALPFVVVVVAQFLVELAGDLRRTYELTNAMAETGEKRHVLRT